MATITESTHTVNFDSALMEAANRARTAYPSEQARIDKGLAIVQANEIELLVSGLALVQSKSAPGTMFEVNGTCPCPDASYGATEGRCKHRWARSLLRWTNQHLLPAEEEGGMDEAPEPTGPTLRPEWLVSIQGKTFIKFSGLLCMAHAKGLMDLTAAWTFNDAGLSLAHAVAVFPYGRFEESGDASPENVTKKVAPHFRRVALTRAKARALRDALNLGDLVSVEELAE